MSTHSGIVLRAQSGHYAVLDDTGVATCRARRRLERPDPTYPEFPVPGDQVGWRLLSGTSARRDGVIEQVQPRRNEISRTRFGSKHVVIANLHRLVIIVAVREPGLDRGLIDRLLAAAEHNGIEAVICFNKIDLVDVASLTPLRRVYETAGYTVLYTSAVDDSGIEDLREALRGHTAALIGPSGAGKSRLIGHLQPGLAINTGAVNDKTGQGRHTTTRVDLHRTSFGALLADTPGVRDFGLWRVEPEELRRLFPEIRALQKDCHYATCSHIPEPHCVVKDAVAAGMIDSGRFNSYRAIFEELRQVSSEMIDREGRVRRERNG